MADVRPVWADRIRTERMKRGWDKAEMRRQLAQAAGDARGGLPDPECLRVYVQRWERGKVGISERYRLLYAAAFEMAEEELFADEEADTLSSNGDPIDPIELIELARQADASDLGADTVTDIALVTDRLCRDYPTVTASVLRDRSEKALRYVIRLLDGRTTLQQHRELLVQAGWLAALLGCVEYDLGRRTSAEVTRRMAYRLGEQAGHGEIVGWAWEMAAWFALMEGRLGDAVAAARTGQEHAGITSAGVQLPLQEARALARMGDADANKALKAGGKVLQQLPSPTHPEHHFVFDRGKYDFYTATILAWLGSDDVAAEENAQEVVRQCAPAGVVRWPTRLATTRINLGLIAGRRGDLDEAIDYGRTALEFERRSAELLPRALDLHRQLAERYPKEPLVVEYEEVLREEYRALPAPDDDGSLP